MNKTESSIYHVAKELIEMFPNGVPEEACMDSAKAHNSFPDPDVGKVDTDYLAEDIWDEIQKLQKRRSK